MKNYTSDFLQPTFKKKFANVIAQIESTSEVEIVVAIKPISAFYYELYLISGVIFAFITFTFFIFAAFKNVFKCDQNPFLFLLHPFSLIKYFYLTRG